MNLSKIENKFWVNLGAPRIEPKAAGWEAPTQPLCYAANERHLTIFFRRPRCGSRRIRTPKEKAAKIRSTCLPRPKTRSDGYGDWKSQNFHAPAIVSNSNKSHLVRVRSTNSVHLKNSALIPGPYQGFVRSSSLHSLGDSRSFGRSFQMG